MEQGHEEPLFLARTKSFTRRSRSLPPALARAFGEAKSRYVVDVPRDGGETSVAPDFVLDYPKYEKRGGKARDLIVEIGVGRGEQITSFAKAHPEMDFLGFEVWLPGLARTVATAAHMGLDNLQLVEADAQQALKTILPAQSVAEVWTFFPDPWRKARHQKRRLVGSDFAETVSRLLCDGGTWRLATDWQDYAEQIRAVLEAAPELQNPYLDQGTGGEGGAPRYPGRIETRFEARARMQGRSATDFVAVRLPRAEII